MKAYKGTDKDIKCRGYQFAPGVEAVEDRAKLCDMGQIDGETLKPDTWCKLENREFVEVGA